MIFKSFSVLFVSFSFESDGCRIVVDIKEIPAGIHRQMQVRRATGM